MTDPLILYTRSGCHLCDQVAAMLGVIQVEYTALDIEKDDVLEQRYGLRIPVLYLPKSGQELFFPFDEQRLRKFLMEGN